VNAPDFDADHNTPAAPLEDPAVTGGTTALLRPGSRTAAHRTAPATDNATDNPTWDPLPLYTPSEAARLLTVPESWLRRRVTARAVPCTFLGKHLRFSRADLIAIVQAGATAPAPTRRPGRHRPPHRQPRQ
jgi:excisionase family DNA binding protein